MTGYLCLILTTLFWSTTFVYSKAVLQHMDPFSYLFWRYLIAFVPLSFALKRDRKALKDGFLLGITNFIALISQFMALTTISPSVAAFIVSLSIPLTPLLEALFTKKRLPALVVSGQVASVVGFFLLSYTPGEQFRLSAGAVLMLVSAFAYAVQFVLIPHLKIQDQLATTAYNIGFTALFAMPFVRLAYVPTAALRPLMYLALVATSLTLWLQLRGQKHVSATTAAYIFAFEPVLAYLFAHLVIGESLSTWGNWGAFLIFLSALLVQYGEYLTSRANSAYTSG
ncbi:DMT family transporter [Coprothermobacteraceae bacterium]|nr:DMT family transporter [Coprothermobacteraceae bacterium]